MVSCIKPSIETDENTACSKLEGSIKDTCYFDNMQCSKINSSSLSSEEKVRYKDVYKQLKDKGYSGKSIDWMLRVKKK